MLSIKLRNKIIVLAVLVGIVIVLSLTAPDKDPELRQQLSTVVEVATVEVHDLLPVETVSGRLEPARKAELHFELPGQVASRPVEPGQAVQQGDSLLILAAGDYEDTLAEADALLAQESRNIQRDKELLKLSRSNYALQKNDLQRLQTLGADSLVSKSRLDETRIKLIQLESEVAQLKSSVASAESRLALRQAARNRAARDVERTRLPAPFAGTVNAVNAQIGDYVTPNETVVDLIDAASLDLYAEVRGTVARSLHQGQAMDVEIDGLPLQGTLVALQLDPSPETFTHALRIRVPGDQARPGQIAQVRLPLQQREHVVAVPVTAILYDEGRAFVFRFNGETLQQVAITPGERVDGLQVVLQGLAENDRIVARDVSSLSDGQQVQVSEPSAD